MALANFPVGSTGQALTPDKANYTTIRAQGAIISTKLQGGMSAQRLDKLGASSMLTVTWTVSTADFVIIDAFFMTTLILGSLPFVIAIIVGEAALTNYIAKFVPDTFGIQTVIGDTYTLGATLEVIPQ